MKICNGVNRFTQDMTVSRDMTKMLSCTGVALQCYQCDSNEDASCPSWQPFDVNINALVDCMSFEASTPGTFCMKVTRESPGCKF